MGWRVKYDLVATTGEYFDRLGNKKKNYVTVGHEFENEEGQRFIKIDVIPIGWGGILNKYEPKQQQQSQVQQDRQTVSNYQKPVESNQEFVEDNLPF